MELLAAGKDRHTYQPHPQESLQRRMSRGWYKTVSGTPLNDADHAGANKFKRLP
nr:MAG TPA: hypothetical protein [Caudoviricetes sp.]